MILIDLNQIVISNILRSMANDGLSAEQMDIDNPECPFRHLILNAIRGANHRLKRRYGELILCDDGDGGYWRKDIFPHYKWHRKQQRDDSKFDWKLVFKASRLLKQELADFFPYRIIKVNKAEADDCIYVLAVKSPENVMIVSDDKDFQQLQTNKKIEQYAPVTKRALICEDPLVYLKHHIIKGDSIDSVPNFLSDDLVFVEGRRQRPIMKTNLAAYMDGHLKDFTTPELLERNRVLIDLRNVPLEIEQDIVDKYHEQGGKPRNKMFNYFKTHGLRNLVQCIQEF